MAVVQIGPEAEQDADGIVEFASSTIARYKLPKDVIFVETLQRSPSGKADYRWAKSIAEGTTTES